MASLLIDPEIGDYLGGAGGRRFETPGFSPSGSPEKPGHDHREKHRMDNFTRGPWRRLRRFLAELGDRIRVLVLGESRSTVGGELWCRACEKRLSRWLAIQTLLTVLRIGLWLVALQADHSC
ncbi:hypothetical protein [Crossiella sp. NPDC003009]